MCIDISCKTRILIVCIPSWLKAIIHGAYWSLLYFFNFVRCLLYLLLLLIVRKYKFSVNMSGTYPHYSRIVNTMKRDKSYGKMLVKVIIYLDARFSKCLYCFSMLQCDCGAKTWQYTFDFLIRFNLIESTSWFWSTNPSCGVIISLHANNSSQTAYRAKYYSSQFGRRYWDETGNKSVVTLLFFMLFFLCINIVFHKWIPHIQCFSIFIVFSVMIYIAWIPHILFFLF